MADEKWPDDHVATADLLERARHGDRDAMEVLFTRHIPVLRRWATGRLPRWARDLTDTGDLVQTTVMEAFRHIDRFEVRGDGALQGYLRRALMNRLTNELRRLSRKPAPVLLDSGIEADAPSPLETAIQQERLLRYTSAMERLDSRDREAIIGRFEFGLSYRELAELLGKSGPDAARMAVTRALERLTAAME